MATLSVTTAVLCTMGTRAVLALTLLLYGSIQKTYRGFHWWTAGACLGALAFASLALRPVAPGASVLLLNGLSSAGMLLILDGTLRFVEGRRMDPRLYVLAPALGGVNLSIYLLAGLILVRQWVFTVPLVAFATAIGVILWRGAPEGARPLYRGAALVHFAYCLAVLVRLACWTSAATTPTDILEAGNTEAAFFAFLCMADLASLGAYLTLNGQRLEADLLLSGQKLQDTLAALQVRTAEVKMLSGILPICAQCKKIRDPEGHWHPVEGYVRERTDAEFSHSVCPDCLHTLYPGFTDDLPDPDRPPGELEG